MRLIQLAADTSEGSELDLHPMITVVSGLTDAAHDRIVRAFRALPNAGDPGCTGLLEAHGVLMDLSSEALAMLDMSNDLDIVITQADLIDPASEGELPVDTVTNVDVEDFLSRTSPGRYPQLDAAREGQHGAREALDILLEATARAKKDRDEAASRHRRAVAALNAASGDGDADFQVGLSLVPDFEEVDDRTHQLELEIERLEDEIARAERGIEELSTIDTRPIQVLVDAIRNPMPVEYVASDRGIELADEFASLQMQVAALEDELEAQGNGPATAMQRLEEARAEVVAAERAMAKPSLLPEDIEELEAAHEEVLDAEAKASGTRRRSGQKRLEEALAAQQAVLDRVGFPTWSAYVMGANLMSIDPLAEQRVERANANLAMAEAEWTRISSMIESDPEHSRLLDQLEGVYVEAFDLLGGDDGREDLETALRELKVPKREVTTEELVDALLYQLELVGLDLGGQNVGVDYAVVVAEAFLAEAVEIEAREVELLTQIESARDAIAAIQTEIAADAADDDAITDLTAIEQANDADRSDENHLAELEEAVMIAAEDLADATEMFEAREALVDAATQVEAVAKSKLIRIATELAESERGIRDSLAEADQAPVSKNAGDDEEDRVDYRLLARLAAQRSVSFAGSVPLVLDDALAGMPEEQILDVLRQLDRMSEAVQIVLLTSDPTITSWVDQIGFDRAAVVTAPAAFG